MDDCFEGPEAQALMRSYVIVNLDYLLQKTFGIYNKTIKSQPAHYQEKLDPFRL